MNTQINLRLPEKMLITAQIYSKENGYSTIQEFIKETLREKLFEDNTITKKELVLVKKLLEASESKNLFKTEEELFRKIRRK